MGNRPRIYTAAEIAARLEKTHGTQLLQELNAATHNSKVSLVPTQALVAVGVGCALWTCDIWGGGRRQNPLAQKMCNPNACHKKKAFKGTSLFPSVPSLARLPVLFASHPHNCPHACHVSGPSHPKNCRIPLYAPATAEAAVGQAMRAVAIFSPIISSAPQGPSDEENQTTRKEGAD